MRTFRVEFLMATAEFDRDGVAVDVAVVESVVVASFPNIANVITVSNVKVTELAA